MVLLATRPLDAQTSKIADEVQPPVPAASGTGIQHIIWLWFENRDSTDINAFTAPYFTSFAAANVNLTNFFGITHPSQPNYLAAFSGSAQGVTGDGYCTFPASTDNLAKQLTAAGKSWRVYVQNYPGNCSDVTASTGGIDGPGVAGQYVRKHNPAIGFESVRLDPTQCANIQPLANFDPTVSFAFVTPNMTNDMHDGTTAQGDAFLQAFVPLVTASPDWEHTLLIVTFDEGSPGNHIYTAAAAPWLVHADLATTYNHFNVLRTIEQAYGLPFLGGAATATTITYLLPPAATPTPTPTATPTPTPTPAPPTPTPTPTLTATPTPMATPPTPTPGQCSFTYLHENFDGVTAPDLPAGWGSSFSLGPADCTPTGTCPFGTNWKTSTSNFTTPPNCAFHDAPGCVTDSSLYSPSFFIFNAFSGANLYFDQNYDLESGRDGAVLEISINGGPFTDFVAAGGTFFGGGYNGTISAAFLNPIAGRAAWTGNSGGNRPVNALMPPAANNSSVILRFRLATDCSGASPGWNVDRIQVYYLVPCPSPTPPPTPTPSPPSTPTPSPSPTPPVTPTPSATPTPPVTPTPSATPTPPITPPPSATPTPPVTPPPSATPTPPITPPPSATPTPTLTPPPSATPSATPATQALNLSTRMRVLTGDSVGIGGFIITGTGAKHVLLRAIGPSLSAVGVPDALPDPVLQLHGPSPFVTITDDNWRDDPAQEALIIASGIQPANDLESAIDATLVPGIYTAIISGKNNTSGVGLVEVYDLSQDAPAKLGNISTRAFVSTGANIVIGGFTLGGGNTNDRIVVRGIGPSLTAQGMPNALADPVLELRDGNGALLISNNDWQDDSIQASELMAAGLAPTNSLEAGIATTLPPGPYTALLSGLNDGTGVGLVEVYDRGAP